MVLAAQGCGRVTHTLYCTVTACEILVEPPRLGATDVAGCPAAECEQENKIRLLFQSDEFHISAPHLTFTRSPTPTLSGSS